MKITVVTINLNSGYSGPVLYKTTEAALKAVKKEYSDVLSRRQIETLEDNLFIEWGSPISPNTISIEECEVNE